MREGLITRLVVLGVAICLVGTLGVGPVTRPAAPSDAGPLPAGAVRRLGELRFLVDGLSRGPAALSPDGRRAAVADAGGASVWDVTTGRRTAVVRPGDSAARDSRLPAAFGVAFTSGDTLLVAMADGPIQIAPGRPRTGTVTLLFADATTGAVRSRLVLPGSDQATGGDDWSVYGEPDAPGGLAVAGDGKHLAFAAGRRSVLLYDLPTGQQVADLGPPPPAADAPRVPAHVGQQFVPRPPGIGHRPLFSGDGRRLVVTAADGQATVYDAATGRPIDGRHYPAARSASLSADGRLLATVTDDGSPHLFELSDGHELDLPADVRAVAPAPAANPTTSRAGRRLPLPLPAPRNGAMTVTFAPVGGALAITRTEVVVAPAPATSPATSRRITRVARMALVDVAARPARTTMSCELPTGNVVVSNWSADGKTVVCSYGARGMVAFDAGTGRQVTPAVQAFIQSTALAISPDGGTVAVGDGGGNLRLVNVDTNEVLAQRPPEPGAYRMLDAGSLRYTTAAVDGRAVLTARWPSRLLHLDPRTLATRRTFGAAEAGPVVPGPTGRPRVFSPDGRWSAEMDPTSVAIVNPATGAIAGSYAYAGADGQPANGLGGQAQGAWFSVDGRRLVVRTTTGIQVADVPGAKFGPPVELADGYGSRTPALSPDGKWVATKEGQTLRVFAADDLLRGDGEPAWTAQLSGRGSSSMEPEFSDDSNWVFVRVPISDELLPAEWGAAVYEAATGRHLFDLPVYGFGAVRFATGRPIAVSSEVNGTLLVWDLRAAIEGTGPAPSKSRTNADLWADLADPDPATALRAGFALLDRGQLAQVSGMRQVAATTRAAGVATTGPSWAELVADLSSPDRRRKESAHKRLETGGPAAAAEVRRALATHPGGETEARLADIARLLDGASDLPAGPADPSRATVDLNDVRHRRAAQLLGWSTSSPTTQP